MRAAADLETLRDRSLFITGGTGFFGKWLVAALARADAELGLGLRVTVLSRDPEAFLRRFPEAASVSAVSFLRGNVADFSAPEDRVDYVLHAATDTVAPAGDAGERELTRSIVEGTRQILGLATRSQARLLYVSSGAVYGSLAGQPGGAREEDAEKDGGPYTAYGRAKREAEQLCAQSGIDFTTARAFAFLGPYLPLDAHFAAGNFLRDARRGGPVMVRGDGTALRSYLHPADLVVWLLRMLIRGQRGRAYNVGSDEVVSTGDLARSVADAAQPPVKVVIQSLQPQGPQNIYLPDVARARTELGLEVAIPLREAIRRTFEFLDATNSQADRGAA
jgi:nucleoside-diphosphate-sugar epimerase